MRRKLLLLVVTLVFSSIAFSQVTSNATQEMTNEEQLHGPTIVVPYVPDGSRATGDDCTDPIIVSIPADAPYTDASQTNCGRTNTYDATCLGSYDGGEDIIYRIDVTASGTLDITMDPKGTTWTGLLIDDNCPGDDETCIDFNTGSSGTRTLTDVAVTAGNSYYIMVDTWPSPTCIPDFDLTITYTAPPSCPAPTAQTETNITATSVDLGWTAGGTEPNWNIEYGPTGFTQGSGTLVSNTTSNPYSLTGLTANTGYDWYVQADCDGAARDESTWVGPSSFTTACTSETAPYSEDFENAGTIPSCWAQGASNAEDWKFSNTGGTNHLGNSGTMGGSTTSGGYFAWVDDSSPHSTGTTLQSPYIDVSGLTTPNLSFYLISDNEGNTNVDFSVDVWDGAAWNIGFYSHNTNTVNGEWEQINVSLSSLTITGDMMFRFIVDENNGTDFYDDVAIDDVSVDEAPSCPPPSAQTETNITTTSVDLGWTAGGTEPNWNIEWGPTGFTQGSGTMISNTATNPHNLTGLTESTTYDWYVQADCDGAARDESSWVGPSTFSTNAAPVTTYPWNEGFENGGSIPAGWSLVYESGTHDWVYQNGGASSNPAAAHSGSYNAAYVHVSTGSVTKLVSLPLDLSGLTTPQLTFWHAQNEWAGDQDELRVYYKTSSGGAWTMITGAEWTTHIADWTEETFTLPSPSSDYYIAFEGTDGYGYGVVVDDVMVQEAPSCPPPTAQTVTNITTTSADLGWTAGGGEINWNIEWGATGFTQGSGTMISNTATNPHSLTGLTESTTYDWYVQSDCDGGARDESTWVGPNTFTTTCGSTTVPYFEDFDGVTAPAFPPCMTVENTNGDGEIWKTDASGLSAPNCAIIFYNATLDMDDWFFTQGLNLTGGVTYEVSFAYGTDATYPEDLDVDWGTAANSTSMSGTPIFSANSFTGGWYAGSGTFTPASSGTYYVGFHGYSPMDQYYIVVDDIQVVEVVASTTWTGSTDNDWQNSGNWTPGLPSSGTDVTVPGGLTNYPTLSNATTIGSILIESGSGGDASILNDDLLIVTGDATVQRYITGAIWHDLSASVQGQTVNALYQGGSPDVWLRHYNEPDNTRTYITNLTDPLDPGAGFEVWVESGPRYDITVNYTGALQRADVTLTTSSTPVALSYTGAHPLGYNLIGNPFASPLDLDEGTWSLTDVTTSFWVWNGTTYLAWNTSSGSGTLTDGIIPMGQGFFIQATSSSASITIPMDARVHSATGFYKSTSAENESGASQMFLKAIKDELWDEMNITFNKEATVAFDEFDTRKLFAYSGSAPQLYSEQSDEKLTINGLPFSLLNEEGTSVKVGFQAGMDGKQKLEANLDELKETEVLLEDLFTGNIQSLVDKPVYEFEANVGDEPDRFILYFNPIPTGVENPDDADFITVYAFDDNLYIRSSGIAAMEDKEVWVYDMFGRTAIHTDVTASTLTTIPVHQLRGYVVVKIISESGVKTNKVYIK